MLEELKEEEIVRKVGGRFKLSTLVQKRMVQLNQGSHALVDIDSRDKMHIVFQEILQDKIYLNAANELAFGATDGEGFFDYGDFDAGDL